MVLQMLEHLGLHMGDKLRLPLVNEGGVRRPFQNPLGPFDGQWMERIIERHTERGGQRRLIDQGLRIGAHIRVQPKREHQHGRQFVQHRGGIGRLEAPLRLEELRHFLKHRIDEGVGRLRLVLKRLHELSGILEAQRHTARPLKRLPAVAGFDLDGNRIEHERLIQFLDERLELQFHLSQLRIQQGLCRRTAKRA